MTAIRIIDDHAELANIGSNTHAQIDTHIAAADNYVKRDGTLALTDDWDIGDGRKILADEIRARDGDGLKLYDDGGKGMFVQDGGKVGVNNPSPSSVLDVVGLGATKDTPVIPDNEDTISIYGDGRAYFKGRDVTNDIEFIMGTSNIGGAFVGAMSNHDLWLRTNNVTRLTILKTTGYVGVNTTYPAELFDIKTNAGFNRAMVLGPKNAVLNDGSYIEFTSSSSPGYGARIGGIRSGAVAANALVFLTGKNTQAERMRIEDDGKVGIATTTPTAKLDVNSDIFRVRTAKTPATAGAAGNTGDRAWDADYFYICVATNTWERTAHATWP